MSKKLTKEEFKKIQEKVSELNELRKDMYEYDLSDENFFQWFN